MKTLITLKCPECHATLNFEENRDVMFCQYCGAKILMNDENNYTYHHIDEADIKRAETERMIQLKEMELEVEQQKNKKILVVVWLATTAILAILGLFGDTLGLFEQYSLSSSMSLMLAMIVGIAGGTALFGNKKKKATRVIAPNETEVTSELACYHEKHYETIMAYAKRAGFTNVQALPLKDLNLLQIKKNGQVESVIINGCDDIDEGDVFPKNATVTISYHSTR